MKISVNKKMCNGCTICNITCPEVFAIDIDGKARLNTSLVPRNIQPIAIEAADECPTRAIQIDYDNEKAERDIPALEFAYK